MTKFKTKEQPPIKIKVLGNNVPDNPQTDQLTLICKNRDSSAILYKKKEARLGDIYRAMLASQIGVSSKSKITRKGIIEAISTDENKIIKFNWSQAPKWQALSQ